MKNYLVYMVDPPWPQQKNLRKVRPRQRRELDYNVLSILEIEILLSSILPTYPHIVFLWEIEKHLLDAEAIMVRLGYKRHARFIWDKGNGVAPSFTVRFSHEYMVWWYKPPMIPIASDVRGEFTTVFYEKAREHSRKPEIAYHIVERLYPYLPRLDVFSREPRPNWDQCGDQINYFQTRGEERVGGGGGGRIIEEGVQRGL